MTADITIPRYAPVSNMALSFQPRQDPETEQWQGQYVSAPSTSAINFDDGDDFAVEVWVRLPKEQVFVEMFDNAIVEKWANPIDPPTTYAYPYMIRCFNSTASTVAKPETPGVIYAGRYDGTHFPVVRSTEPVNDGQFHHVAFVKEGSTLTLYVDAEPQATAEDTVQTSTKNDYPLSLGYRPGGSKPLYLTGSLAQLRIWGRALPEEEVAAHFIQGPLTGPGGGTPPEAQKLVGDWRCNEGYGTSVYHYALGNHGRLGGDEGAAASPTWTVSTIRLAPLFNLAPNMSVTLPVPRSAAQEETPPVAATPEQTAQKQPAAQAAEAAPKEEAPPRSRRRRSKADRSKTEGGQR